MGKKISKQIDLHSLTFGTYVRSKRGVLAIGLSMIALIATGVALYLFRAYWLKSRIFLPIAASSATSSVIAAVAINIALFQRKKRELKQAVAIEKPESPSPADKERPASPAPKKPEKILGNGLNDRRFWGWVGTEAKSYSSQPSAHPFAQGSLVVYKERERYFYGAIWKNEGHAIVVVKNQEAAFDSFKSDQIYCYDSAISHSRSPRLEAKFSQQDAQPGRLGAYALLPSEILFLMQKPFEAGVPPDLLELWVG